MGKRQHQKDKMYLTYTEWSQFYGGKKTASLEDEHIKFKRLPFDHCSITMAPFENPYCDTHGNVFELEAILAFLKTFKINPITGEPLEAKSLIKLNFSKNINDDSGTSENNRFQCPALFRQFTKNSHIIAIATTGNVFSFEAIDQLNIRTKNWKDLVNDVPFTRKDMIVIQDPSVLEKFNISTFHHIQKRLRVETEDEKAERKDPTARLNKMSNETKDILNELESTYKAVEVVEQKEAKPDKFNAAHYSTGKVGASFTSTAIAPSYISEAAIVQEDLIRYERVKKKGYVRLQTSHGPLNLELFCDSITKTCESFMKHCANGYYDGVKFHRSIRNFMVQGGDPTGTGMGGTSIWNEKFEDEFKPNLTHSGRGILSMANSGPNTNGSQFFITYRSCKHLDGKHTIFGKVVGGIETLNEMEKVEVDNKDRPIEDIVIQKTQIFVDPFLEADEQLVAERQAEIDRESKEQTDAKKMRVEKKQTLKVYREGVGKYLSKDKSKDDQQPSTSTGSSSKKQKGDFSFNNFKSW